MSSGRPLSKAVLSTNHKIKLEGSMILIRAGVFIKVQILSLSVIVIVEDLIV